MTIRFAPSRSRNPSAAIIRRGLCNRGTIAGANDNGPPAVNDGNLLVDTLRHFGVHGLRSAEAAAQCALAARDAGDEAGFTHWLSVCRMLDRRLGESLNSLAACST